jgi:hypothetical protein
MASSFTRDELFDLEYAVKTSSTTKRLLPERRRHRRAVARLEDLQAKIQGMLRESAPQT